MDELKLWAEARLLQRNGQHEEAIAAFDRLLAAKPGLGPALAAKGESILQLGAVAEAIKILEQAMEVELNASVRAAASVHLATALIASDRAGEARERVWTAIEEAGADVDPTDRWRLRRLLTDLGGPPVANGSAG